MHAPFLTVLLRDLRLAIRQPRELVNPPLFFVLAVALFPLGVSPENTFLQQAAGGILWVAALLATLLSLDHLFRSDMADGSLDQMLLMPQPVYLLVLAKVIAHWLLTGLPLVLLTPLLATLLFLPWEPTWALMLALLLGTPVLSFIGSIGAALTVALPGSSVLLSLLVLPLFIPVLIFGSAVVQAAQVGNPYDGQLAILGALLALAMVSAPIAAGAALRLSGGLRS